jgi:hypothetical protein
MKEAEPVLAVIRPEGLGALASASQNYGGDAGLSP